LQEINLFIDIQLGVMSLKNRLLDVNVNEFVYFFVTILFPPLFRRHVKIGLLVSASSSCTILWVEQLLVDYDLEK
jgi:hypothetical protein